MVQVQRWSTRVHAASRKREQEIRQTALDEYSLLPKCIAIQYTKTPEQSGLRFNI